MSSIFDFGDDINLDLSVDPKPFGGGVIVVFKLGYYKAHYSPLVLLLEFDDKRNVTFLG